MIYMDENGDAEDNYTLIALDHRPVRGYGLYPIGYFVGKEEGTNLPVSKLSFMSYFILSLEQRNICYINFILNNYVATKV